MSESRSFTSIMRRVCIPLIIALALVIATVIISGSALIRIEDVHVNRILAGTYGTPDWRVQEMNPLLAQLLALLYSLIPAINWYGVMLLGLLFAAAAMAMSLPARKPGGLLPAVVVVSPILLLLTNSLQSPVVCALCAGAGVAALLDGLQKRKERGWRIAMGGVLFIFATLLSLQWSIIVAVAVLLCWLPCSIRDARIKGLLLGLPVLLVIAGALFGYTALMYGSPEMSAYRQNYALYERVQHSSLKDESESLLTQYGEAYIAAGEATVGHDHEEGEEEHEEEESVIPANSFDAVGWSLNDASLFFSRYGSDIKITDPETLRALDEKADHISLDMGRLFKELLGTVKKPQFLLLIGLFVVSALAVVLTSRRKGLIALLAALIAFGGHVLALLCYYDSFANIAPFYLIAILVLLYHFDGEDAKAWLKKTITASWLRIALSILVLACFAVGMGGLMYYTRANPANSNHYTMETLEYITPYIEAHPEMLFIGDNPNDRFKPDTLTAPVRGQDQNLLAGSYDLYSPRSAALMTKFGVTNPLPESVNRPDIGYVSMSIEGSVSLRLTEAYDLYMKNPNELASHDSYAERIIELVAYTQEEVDAIQEAAAREEESAANWAEALKDPEVAKKFEEAFPLIDDTATEGGGTDGGTEAAGETPASTETPMPAASPSPQPEASQTPHA